jgi:LCP family protein required for cell wall assembly
MKKKTKLNKKQIVLLTVLGVLVLALIGTGVFVWHVLKRPETFFDPVVRQTATAAPEVTPIIDIDAYLPRAEPGVTPIPTVQNDTSTPQPQQTETLTSGIVNIALFGIDAYEDGRSTSGSMPHTDANLVLAVNFDTKEVSLISIARDCLTTAPGHVGYYKFNGVFNVGGGMDDPKAGFELSCRAAEEWLGGVSIPYYYGVDFQALIDLVDLLGGIDFNVDIKLYTLDKQVIYPGFRHLDGQGVMAYMRMRRSAGGLDSNRTARQRKMLIAIFKKLKSEGKLSMVPDLLKTMGDNVYTNTTLVQTTALVNFARGIDPDSIKSYSIQGKIRMAYDWAFCFIDQQARIDMIKTVYGFEAQPMGVNSPVYETFLHEHGFKAIQYLNITKKLFAAVHDRSSTQTMSEEQKRAYAQCWQDYSNLQAAFGLADAWTRAHYEEKAKLTDGEKNERKTYYDALQELQAKLRESADALNAAFDQPVKMSWNRSVVTWSDRDSDINEVYVDFR